MTVAVKNGPLMFAKLYRTEALYERLPQQRLFSAYR